jgi:hypothetical protein
MPTAQPTHSRDSVQDPELERSGRRLGKAGGAWLLAGVVASIPGAVLFVVGLIVATTVIWAVGLALLAISAGPLIVGSGLLGAGAVSRRSARHKTFA